MDDLYDASDYLFARRFQRWFWLAVGGVAGAVTIAILVLYTEVADPNSWDLIQSIILAIPGLLLASVGAWFGRADRWRDGLRASFLFLGGFAASTWLAIMSGSEAGLGDEPIVAFMVIIAGTPLVFIGLGIGSISRHVWNVKETTEPRP
jgi:4-amino-4-deoxy-L-arabinose transferase-like glycosyltransferase